ncbi:MAG TPA: hypothetical protein VMU04_26015 [Candidatus Acidoferrum sp.]|nr:hypothetical protein [Candidatus Acidoferrum sp.]
MALTYGNIQHPTSNIQHPMGAAGSVIGCWMFDVGCWMLPAPGSVAYRTQGPVQAGWW